MNERGDPPVKAGETYEVTIDAVGGTGYVDVYVLADTNDAAATKTISTTLGGGSNTITWTDGVSSTTNLDGTPIAGATVTY